MCSASKIYIVDEGVEVLLITSVCSDVLLCRLLMSDCIHNKLEDMKTEFLKVDMSARARATGPVVLQGTGTNQNLPVRSFEISMNIICQGMDKRGTKLSLSRKHFQSRKPADLGSICDVEACEDQLTDGRRRRYHCDDPCRCHMGLHPGHIRQRSAAVLYRRDTA